MFQHLVFDAVIGERPGGVEAERPQVAGQDLHRGDAARLDGLDELRARREGEILPAPEAEPLRIGEVVDRRRPGGRDIDHAGIGQLVLQAQARPALLRGLVSPRSPFDRRHWPWHGFRRRGSPRRNPPQPVDDLVDAGFLGPAFFRAQRGIGGEEDALGERDVAALREARQRRDQQPLLAER
jgi:hypothetical protein